MGRGDIRFWIRLAIVLLLAIGVVLVGRLWLGGPTRKSGNQSGLRLVGIRPDFSDTVYDRSGRKRHNEHYAGPVYFQRTASNQVMREFIFEYSTNGDFVLPRLQVPRWHIWSTNFGVSEWSFVSVYPQPDGTTRVTLQSTLPEFSFVQRRLPRWLAWLPIQGVWKLPMRREAIKVNVTAEYLPVEANSEFQAKINGPIEIGAHLELEPGLAVTALRDGPLGEARFQLPDISHRPWLVFYDSALRRHWAEVSRQVDRNRQLVTVATVRNVPRTNLAFVAVEKPRTKTFSNIPVRLARWKNHEIPAPITALEAKLGGGVAASKVVANTEFQDPRQAAEAVSVVRGERVRKFWEATFGWTWATNSGTDALVLDPKGRRGLERAADSWLNSYNPEVRAIGMLGELALQRRQALPAAIAGLPDYSGEIAHAVAAWLVAHAVELTDEEINALGQLIRRKDSVNLPLPHLFQCLHERNSPAGNALLVEFGLDARTRVWTCAVLESLHILTNANVPQLLRERAILMRMIPARTETENLAAQEIALEGLTPVNSLFSTGPMLLFLVGLEQLGGPHDKMRATGALLAILESWDPLQQWELPPWFIRRINEWNGTDFGGLRPGVPDSAWDNATAKRTVAEISGWWRKRHAGNN